jgi:hypothetical protein
MIATSRAIRVAYGDGRGFFEPIGKQVVGSKRRRDYEVGVNAKGRDDQLGRLRIGTAAAPGTAMESANRAPAECWGPPSLR